MVLLHILLATLLAGAVKLTAYYRRIVRWGLDDPDPDGRRAYFAGLLNKTVDGALLIGLALLTIHAHEQSEMIPWLYSVVFVATFCGALVTRFSLAKYRRLTGAELKTAALAKIVESLLYALFLTLIAYPMFRLFRY